MDKPKTIRFNKNGIKHGEARRGKDTVEYRAWLRMKSVALSNSEKIREKYSKIDPNKIKICERWLDKNDGYKNFLEDIGRRPSPIYKFIRLDKSEGFNRENCVWWMGRKRIVLEPIDGTEMGYKLIRKFNMGCDIHFWVEKKVSGKWALLDEKDGNMFPCTWCCGESDNSDIIIKCYMCGGSGKNSLDYSNRNYITFSILADVRNWEEGHERYIKPISKPRGIPEDSRVFEIYNQDMYWAHSGSTHTLKQLKEYDWNKKVVGGYYNGETYADICGDFYYSIIPPLEKFSDIYGGDENVRIVFFFDN